jgi:hypothetical protein
MLIPYRKLKATIEIEQLVSWAYDEIARGESAVADGGSGALFGIMSGVPFGDGNSVASQPYAAVAPAHPDALAVDRAVRSLPDMALDWPENLATLLGGLIG